ncbi:thioredoxin family protein [Rhodohalobacter barkolensis]|uniref:Thioredoxin family protein n=1 Tax=Rhodohalobacter barkolensis TaxID=2053187 RepID=A0A2N0VF35_9BACT|nr:thioredoxin family protein [Rhodohalobacter barkolensis]PKD42806.1 thioredoxin family protein [Rhodohalobacter barkolensis]
MSAVNSTMLELGTKAPKFSLQDTVTGKTVQLKDYRGNKALLVMFISNHCPYVKKIKEGLTEYAKDYLPKGVGIVAICSNDVENYPDDSPEKMKEDAAKYGYPFPYLYDETQEMAKAYKAACTPDLFLFDEKHELVYRGQFDNSRPGNDEPVTGKDLREATDQVLAGEEVPEDQTPSIGCNIKWKKGNEPEYFG